MKDKDNIVAISTIDNKVMQVKNVSDKEYKELLNKQELEKQEKQQEKEYQKEQIADLKNGLEHCERVELFIAKAIYDNFVIRGELEDNIDFERAWYSCIFENGELDSSLLPKEFNEILAKVRGA